jgi:hypothetical protein
MAGVTLDFAQEAFRSFPNNETAARYLRTLLEYEADDMIGDDTFLDGIVEVMQWLDPKASERALIEASR